MWKLLFPLLVAANLGAQASLRYTAELEELRELRQRLELFGPGWRFLGIDAREGLEPVYQAVGLSSPYLTLGPLAPCGLLRQLASPLGHSPGSEALGERTGFRLEGSLAGTSRRGLLLEPLPERLALFAVSVPSGPAQAGGILHLGSRTAAVELLTAASLPAPEAETEDWSQDTPPFPGGALAHLACGADLAFERDADRLSLFLDGALSGGERVEPGAFLNLQAGLERSSWAVLALLGFCTDAYRTPAGDPGAYGAVLGGCVQIDTPRRGRVGGSWLRRIGRLQERPEEFVETMDRAELEAEACWSHGGRWRARLAAGTEGMLRILPDGAREREAAGSLQLRLGNADLEGSLGIEGGWKEAPREVRLKLTAGLRRRGLLVRGGVESVWTPEPAVGVFADIELSRNERIVFLHLREGSATLGWSAAQALP